MAKKDDEEAGPLAFLDRLLDEERDSNLHLGDVRFWKHLEHINRAHVFRTTSLEYRTVKMMFCEAVFFSIFLVAFTSFAIGQRDPSLFESRRQQMDYWGGCVRTRDERNCRLDEITTQEHLMDWLKNDLVEKAFVEMDQYLPITSSTSIFRLQSGIIPWTPRYVGDTKTSVLIGGIRIRQLRVQYNLDCAIMDDYIQIHPDCFPKYSPGVESKMKWHPTWTPEHIKPHYKWYFANETEQGDTVGYHGVYPGTGFLFDLPLNKTGAQMRLKELEEWSWLDVRTRAVIVELSTLNPNVNVFVNTKFTFEFPAVGGIYIKRDVTSFRAITLSLALAATDDVAGTFAMLILTTAMFLMLALYVAWLIFQNGKRYFTYFWSWVDLVILLLFLIMIIQYLAIFNAAGAEPNLHPEVLGDPEMFFPIGKFVPQVQLCNNILATLGLMCWLKVLKYFTLSALFMGFVRIIERCIVNLLCFASLLFLVLFGFAVALHLGYGDDSNLFSTIWGSLVAVTVAPAGGVDFEPIFAPGDTLGPILIFVYIILVFLLMLNTFMAISVDTYSVCMFEISEVKREAKSNLNPVVIFLWTYVNAVFGIKLVGKENEDDLGGLDEQEISLSSLPEAVQVRYLQEKRRMENLFESVKAQIAEEERLRRDPEFYNTTTEGDGDDDEPPPPPMQSEMPPPPLEDEDLQRMMVKRVQLQRMLEDSEVLREICGTSKAVEIVRRFKVSLGAGDAFEAVAQLQASVAEKLQELEARGLDLSFDEMEELQSVSTELHSALTESQKEWRAELLSVLQMASLLSKALIDLTGQMAKVQKNHNDLAESAASMI